MTNATASALLLNEVSHVLRDRGLLLGTSPSADSLPPIKIELATDSRRIKQQDLFIAYKGVSTDGHGHIAGAAANGASALVIEDPSAIPAGLKTPWFHVKSGRAAWAFLAARRHGDPQKHLLCAGVTGTNGKTSTVWMVRALLKKLGIPTVAVGTLGAWIGDAYHQTTHTTPDPDELYRILREAVNAGVRHLVMETSSHAITQEKLGPIRYHACAFTSFSQDHLDLHGTMDDYFAAKCELFTKLATSDARYIVCDKIDRPLPVDLSKSKDRWVYGGTADLSGPFASFTHSFKYKILSSGVGCTELEVTLDKSRKQRGKIPYFGGFFIDNFSAALLVAEKLSGSTIGPDLWHDLPGVPGRLEVVKTSKEGGPSVVVDYAHTPDGLEKALQGVRPWCQGKLWVVFGCGGERDRGKRPQMAKIAQTFADRLVVTSDNPRREPPSQIIDDILTGFGAEAQPKVEPDRKEAIRFAIHAAGPQDVVLVAGKGHETYQLIGTQSLRFDDREIARTILEGRT